MPKEPSAAAARAINAYLWLGVTPQITCSVVLGVRQWQGKGMKRSTQQILTTHPGNLHRPPDLEELYRQQYVGEPYDEQALAECLRSAVAEVVRKQVELGVDIVNDGEYNKFFFLATSPTGSGGWNGGPLLAR